MKTRKANRLFPADSDHGVICIREQEVEGGVNIEASFIKFSTHKEASKHRLQSESNLHKQAKWIGQRTRVTMLPNGFYFCHPIENTHICDREVNKNAVLLGNYCISSRFQGTPEPFIVDDFIDVPHITCVSQKEIFTLLAGVNTERNKIYTYYLIDPDEESNQFRIITENSHDRSTIGTCLYTSPADTKIVAFCGLNEDLAILHSNGDVRVGSLYANKLDFNALYKGDNSFEDGKLFLTAAHLIVYSPINNVIRIWDRNSKNKTFRDIKCKELGELHLSADGNYLIGVLQTNSLFECTVHCYDVYTLQLHELKFKEQIDDIVIAKNGAVFAVMPYKMRHKSIIPTPQDIRHLGDIKSLIKNKGEFLSVDST